MKNENRAELMHNLDEMGLYMDWVAVLMRDLSENFITSLANKCAGENYTIEQLIASEADTMATKADMIERFLGEIADHYRAMTGLVFRPDPIPDHKTMTDEQRTHMIGAMYEARKNTKGGDRRSEEFSKSQNATLKNGRKPRIDEIVGEELGVNHATVARSYKFAKGVEQIAERPDWLERLKELNSRAFILEHPELYERDPDATEPDALQVLAESYCNDRNPDKVEVSEKFFTAVQVLKQAIVEHGANSTEADEADSAVALAAADWEEYSFKRGIRIGLQIAGTYNKRE